MLRRMIVPEGRGRVGKTLVARALYDEMVERCHPVTAWDLDLVPMLANNVNAARPGDGSPMARKSRLEDAIHETIGGTSHAIVDVGPDDLLFYQLEDQLPSMTDLFVENGLETVAVHVLGPEPKDMAFYRAAQKSRAFARQVVVLNYGLVPEQADPDTAFQAVRKAVGNTCQVFVVGALPQDRIIKPLLADENRGKSLREMADGPGLDTFNRMVLTAWLETSIGTLVNALVEDPLAVDDAAE